MSACTTSVPARSMTLTGTTSSVPSLIVVKSGGSRRACARSDVVAFSRLDAHRLGIQRWLDGTVASISMPIAISAALHDAMACTVCRWMNEEPLGHGHLGEPGLHPHHVRHDRGEIGHPDHRRRREQSGAAGTPGESFPHLIGSARQLPCRRTLLWSKKGDAERQPSGRFCVDQRFGGRPDLGHTVRVALSRVSAFLGLPGHGIRPAPKRAHPVPTSIATIFPPRPSARRATHPTAGTGEPQTGKQRRR